jgi:phosphotransferase system HPr (HPr) family protein
MRSVEVVITNPSGLHARPAAVFVRAAARFRSAVTVRNLGQDGPAVSAKSILSVLAQGATRGARIEITASGEDEEDAVGALARLVAEGLGEAGDHGDHAPGHDPATGR